MKKIGLLILACIYIQVSFSQVSRISVSGNKFVNESGQTIQFKGYSCADPDIYFTMENGINHFLMK